MFETLKLTPASFADLSEAVMGVELVLVVTPIAGLRPSLKELGRLKVDAPILWACKGFEAGSSLLPHQVVAEEFPALKTVGVLSGPSFAKEVALGLPAAVTLAAVLYVFRSLVDADIPLNAGTFRPLSITSPPGTVLNAEFPDACGVRFSTAIAFNDAVTGVLLKAAPEKMAGPTCGTGFAKSSGTASSFAPAATPLFSSR